MSGAAAAFKGDVDILFTNNLGKYIIECKTSAALSNRSPSIRWDFKWLDKLQREATAMNAAFGIFIMHYYNKDFLDDYVLIRGEDVRKIQNRYTTPEWSHILQEALLFSPIVDIRYLKIGKDRKAHNIVQIDVESTMVEIKGIRFMQYDTPNGIYLVVHLKHFRDMMKNA